MTAEGVRDMVWDWITGRVKGDGGPPLEHPPSSTPAAHRIISSIHTVSNALLQHQLGGGAAATTLNQRVYRVLQGGMNVFKEALARSPFVRFSGEALAQSALAFILPTYPHMGDEALPVVRQQSQELEDILMDQGSTGSQKVKGVEAWMLEVVGRGRVGLHDGGPLLPEGTATTLLLSLLPSGRLLSALRANNSVYRIWDALRRGGRRVGSKNLFFLGGMGKGCPTEKLLAGVDLHAALSSSKDPLVPQREAHRILEALTALVPQSVGPVLGLVGCFSLFFCPRGGGFERGEPAAAV